MHIYTETSTTPLAWNSLLTRLEFYFTPVSILVDTLTQLGFNPSAVDPRVLPEYHDQEFVSPITIVDDLLFAYDSSFMIVFFEQMISSTFYVKRFGELTTFLD